MTILEEVPAELAAVASALHATPVLAGFAVARGPLRFEVALAAPGRLRIRVERSDLFVPPPASGPGRSEDPYRAGQAPVVPVIDPLSPVELALDRDADSIDDRLRVDTKLDESAVSQVLTPEVRRRVTGLLEEGYASVVLLRDGPSCEAERDIEEGLPADAEMIRTGMDRLAELVASMPTIATRAARRRTRMGAPGGLVWAIPAILLATMIAQMVLWDFLNPVANFAGLLIGLGIALTFGPIAAMLQMRRGRTMQSSFLVFGWIALVAPLGLQSALLFFNCALDSSPVTPWQAQVERLEVRKQEKSVVYEAVLQRRQPKALPVKLSIDEDLYRTLLARPEARRVLILDLHRGALELAWYTRVELAP